MEPATERGRRPRKPFPLLHYFAPAGLGIILAVSLASGAVAAWLVHASFLHMERDEADSVAEDLVALFASFGSDPESWGTVPIPPSLRREALREMENFQVTRFSLYAPDGRLLEEVDRGQGGPERPWTGGLETARAGATALRWENGLKWIHAILGASGRGLVESYTPVRLEGRVVAIASLHRDLSPNVLEAEAVLPKLMGVAALAGLAVFGGLYILVARADRTIRRQHLEIEQARGELERSNRLLAELNRRKDEFYAMCSHDLRSPLIAVHAGCRLLLEDGPANLDEEPRRILGENLRNAEAVLDLLDNLLDLARIEEDEARLELERVDLAPLIGELVTATRTFASIRDVELALELPEDGVSVRGDRRKLLRLFGNILSNAIKQSPGRAVRVVVEHDPAGARVSIEDSGPGMSPEHRAVLVGEEGGRTRRTRSGVPGGHGLGLVIVRRLVDLHGGTIRVRSNPGSGTTLSVTLPPS